MPKLKEKEVYTFSPLPCEIYKISREGLNAIRPFAIGRKNWLFMGSPSGAKAGAIFYSLIQTCKANNIEPYKYLCTMLHRIRECNTDDDYRKLLPQNIDI